MNEIVLNGCAPTPLASYLKALGIFRLVAEQKDQEVRALWHGERFSLRTRLSPDELAQFLLEEYAPTPILAPWNGGSGFFPGDNKDGFAPIASSSATRFGPLRESISVALEVLSALRLKEKPGPDAKPRLLLALRAQGTDAFLSWLDAAVVLASQDPAYPPLLGTGGNDGRLDFTNNFLQRLTELFDVATGSPIGLCGGWLTQALQGTPTPRLSQKAIGQFAPGSIGGANATSGFSTDSRINPWDFVLMLEGALLFVTATSRRLESNQHATLAYPFTVYASSGGSGAMAQGDAASARGEIWMPLWSAPAQLTELRALLAEGRATLGRRPARDGLDFARAVSRLGTDRGIGAFQRYGFMVRNGLAYLATPIARVESPHAAQSDLVADLERGQFLDLLRRHARGKDTPASLKRSVAQLENALFALTRPGAGQPTIQRALILLGEVMQTLAVSRKGQEGVWLVPSLSERWVLGAYRDSAEFRIALALASLPRMTAHVAPVGWNRAAHRWEWQRESRSCVWGKGNLVRNLAQIVARRVVEAVRSEGGQEPFAAPTKLGATNRDLAAFLATEAYDAGIAALVRGLVWARLPDALPPAPKASNPVATSRCTLPVAFGILKPFFVGSGLLRELNRLPQDAAWTAPSEIPRLLVAGQVQDALSIAWRRSHTAGMGWPQGACPLAPALDGPRLLAALMTPLQRADLAQLVPRKEEQHSPNRAAHS